MAKDKTPAADGGPALEVAPTAPEEQVAASAKKLQWFRLTVIVLFALVYAWDLFEATSNLLGKVDEMNRINEVRQLNGYGSVATPWAWLLANLLLPLVVFGLALLVSRKRSVGVLAVTLLAGLGVVAAVSLSFIAVVLRIT